MCRVLYVHHAPYVPGAVCAPCSGTTVGIDLSGTTVGIDLSGTMGVSEPVPWWVSEPCTMVGI